MPTHAASCQPRTGLALAPLLTSALAVVCVFLYWQGAGSLSAVRIIDRLTVRVAAAFFSLAFAAPALASVSPNGINRWILDHRLNFTWSFLAAFGMHLFAIARFFVLDAEQFRSISPPLTIALRAIGLVFVCLILFRAMNWTHAPFWNRLSTFGDYYLWGGFLNGFAKRIGTDRLYLLPVALLIAVMILKLAELFRGRRPRLEFNNTK